MFQSPIRRERSCSEGWLQGTARGDSSFNPLFVGKGLAPRLQRARGARDHRGFNPLFVGKGLAPAYSAACAKYHAVPQASFNPLFVGKGLAPRWLYDIWFLRDGVSIPYSSGKVLLREIVESRHRSAVERVSIPYSSGKVLLRRGQRRRAGDRPTTFQSPIRRERSCSQPGHDRRDDRTRPGFNPLFVGKGLAPGREVAV